jgi:hypothetical protein
LQSIFQLCVCMFLSPTMFLPCSIGGSKQGKRRSAYERRTGNSAAGEFRVLALMPGCLARKFTATARRSTAKTRKFTATAREPTAKTRVFTATAHNFTAIARKPTAIAVGVKRAKFVHFGRF